MLDLELGSAREYIHVKKPQKACQGEYEVKQVVCRTEGENLFIKSLLFQQPEC